MLSRRQTLLTLAASGAVATPAAALVVTPSQTAGPFYPDSMPRESDADLVRIAGGPPATGEEIVIEGRVLDPSGKPIPGAAVELWQANHFGRYAHFRDTSPARLDPNFQGFGTVRSDGEGRYRFRTIRPGLYPGRTRHVHFRATGPGFESLTTQMYFEGEPGNARDGLLNAIRDPQRRAALVASFSPNPQGFDTGRFDIVLGTRSQVAY